MFPIVDKPVMQYLVEEAIAAGCEDIIIVTGRSKRAIEDHFDSNIELEQRLDKSGKFEYLKKVQNAAWGANIVYVRQPYPKWDGDAILRAKNLIWDEPFLVLFWDDIIDNDPSAAEQLISKFHQVETPVIATIQVAENEVSRYGIVETDDRGKVETFIEKPKPDQTDSTQAAIGKYVLTPEIFEYLENAGSSVWDGEIRLADAFIAMQQESDIYALEVEGTRYDTGNLLGYLKASIAYAMKDEEVATELREFLKDMSHSNMFDIWNTQKEKIDREEWWNFYIKQREIWSVAMWKNIGYEEDGKWTSFQRPVLVLKKLGNMYLCASLTRKGKNTDFYYKVDTDSYILTSQPKLFDKKRFVYKVWILSEDIFSDVQKKLQNLWF